MKVKMRDRTIGIVISVSLLLAACSSTGGPKPVPPSPAAPPVHDALALEYRAELEDAARLLGGTRQEPRDFKFEIEVPQHHAVEAAVKYFSSGRRETIQNSFRRSAPWVPMINEVLESYGLPPDLAYLPVIESGYRLVLTSSAGAHGMWQFMPPTAREYGLRVDWWVDERADPVKATRAAAHYLSDLHRMFGDWSLALAAYNCGPGRVRRTLEAHNATTFWELLEKKALPKETLGYVPTFYATVVLAAAPEQYGFDLPTADFVEYPHVTVRGPLSLEFLAAAASLDEEQLRTLNPELHKGIVPPEGWSLRVPEAAASTIASRDWYLEDSLVRMASYSMRRDESLDSFARRLGIGTDELKEINGFRGNSLPAGSTLWIPLNQAELSARLTNAGPSDQWHVVAPGDTLYSIARRNGISIEDLVQINRLETDSVIRPGDRLIVRSPGVYGTGGM